MKRKQLKKSTSKKLFNRKLGTRSLNKLAAKREVRL